MTIIKLILSKLVVTIILFQEAGIDVQEMVCDIYNHFKNSTPRKLEFKEFCTFVEVDYKTILKHIRVRWLSLNTALERVLQLYKSLQSYFLSIGIILHRF